MKWRIKTGFNLFECANFFRQRPLGSGRKPLELFFSGQKTPCENSGLQGLSANAINLSCDSAYKPTQIVGARC